jgi:hypothetical protein
MSITAIATTTHIPHLLGLWLKSRESMASVNEPGATMSISKAKGGSQEMLAIATTPLKIVLNINDITPTAIPMDSNSFIVAIAPTLNHKRKNKNIVDPKPHR